MVSSPSSEPGGARSDQAVSTPGPEEDGQVGHFERLGVIHNGARYAFGFGSDNYAIWDEYSPGAPLEQFPPSQEGRRQGWQRYVTLEPSAQDADVWQSKVQLSELELRRAKQKTGRRRWAIVAAVAAVAIVAFVLTRGGGEKEVSTAGANLADEAHAELTGAIAAAEDLQLDALRSTGFGGLYPNVLGTWKGQQVQLTINFNTPVIGANPTLFNPHRRLDLILTLEDGSEHRISSVDGECTVTFDTLEAAGVAGSFSCEDLPDPQGSELTIDAEGTFSGSG